MTAEQIFLIGLGCLVSVALDWAIYERIGTSLEVLLPQRFNPSYSRLSTARKVGIAVVGGLIAAGAVKGASGLLWTGLGLWFALHVMIYISSASAPQRQSDTD